MLVLERATSRARRRRLLRLLSPYFKTLNNRTGGPNNEYRGGPGGPGSGFGGPRGGFLNNRRSGLPLVLLPLKPPLGPPTPLPGPPGPPRYLLLAPPYDN